MGYDTPLLDDEKTAAGFSMPILGSQYCDRLEQVFILKKKAFTCVRGDSIDIFGASGDRLVYSMNGRPWSCKRHRVLLNSHTKDPVAEVHRKRCTWPRRWVVSTASGEIAQVKRTGLRSASIYLQGSKDSTPLPEFTLKGNFWKTKYWILYNGQPCAEVTRKKSFKTILRIRDVYTLRVSPGFDAAIMLCLVLVLDKMFQCHPHTAGGSV